MSDLQDLDARFEARVAPVRQALLGMLDATILPHASRVFAPDELSTAKREFTEEERYSGQPAWGSRPLTEFCNDAHLLLGASENTARALCALLVPGVETPVFAHMVLARSALEQAARAWWLLDPGIGLRARIARRINDKLASLRELTTYPDPVAQSKAQRDIDTIVSEAERLGFGVKANRRGLAEELRLTSTKLMGEFFGHQDDPTLGTVIYEYFSAVDHGSAHGLMVSLGRELAVAAPDGNLLAPLRVESDEVCSVLTATIIGLARPSTPGTASLAG